MDPAIPLVFVSGNHDLGNTPTPDTVEQYRRGWGDDFFCFWVGGVLCLVLNSQLFFDGSACPELRAAQDEWLEEQLQRAARGPCRHVLVFQHIPLYLKRPDEEDDYFNLQRGVRESLIERFRQAGTSSSRPIRSQCPQPELFYWPKGQTPSPEVLMFTLCDCSLHFDYFL